MLNDLSAVQRSVETARGLPNAFYVSEDLFRTEKASIFFPNWTAIGFGKDVSQPGDTYPVNFMGRPLLMVRDKEGRVRVYDNVCRHRGMILIDRPTRISAVIRCPYHSWCYDLDGKLRTTPHVGGSGIHRHEALKRDELGLREVRSHVWRDVVFVNISGMAPAFERYARELIARWSEYEQPIHHGGADSSFKLDLRANWKLAVDNYCESYHLPWVHPGLNRYSRLEDHYTIASAGGASAGGFSGQGTQVYNPVLDPGGRQFARFSGLEAKWDKAAEYIALYPNVLFGVHKDHVYAIVLEPRGSGHTVEHVEIYYADEAMRGDDWATLRTKNTEIWKGVFAEDVAVCEGMQKGRSSESFDGGRFSPVMDGAVHFFHAWIAKNVSDGAGAVEAA